MDFDFSPEQQAFAEQVEEFLDEVIAPLLAHEEAAPLEEPRV